MRTIFLMVAAAAALTCLAETVVHDDLAPLRPAGNSNTYWDTSSRPAVTLNATSISIGATRAADSTSARSGNSLAAIAATHSAQDVSAGRNITTEPVSIIINFR